MKRPNLKDLERIGIDISEEPGKKSQKKSQRWWDSEAFQGTEEHKTAPRKTNTWAIVCFAVSLTGIALPAMVFGHIARSQIRTSGGSQKGSGMALAGLIISYISMIVYVLLAFWFGYRSALVNMQ